MRNYHSKATKVRTTDILTCAQAKGKMFRTATPEHGGQHKIQTFVAGDFLILILIFQRTAVE